MGAICLFCGDTSHVQCKLESPPCYLSFSIPLDMHEHAFGSSNLLFESVTDTPHKYELQAIIYLGEYHFTACVKVCQIWHSYDGQKSSGKLTRENIDDRDTLLLKLLEGRKVYVYIYCLQT